MHKLKRSSIDEWNDNPFHGLHAQRFVADFDTLDQERFFVQMYQRSPCLPFPSNRELAIAPVMFVLQRKCGLHH